MPISGVMSLSANPALKILTGLGSSAAIPEITNRQEVKIDKKYFIVLPD
jgi:hypothetical protein